MPERIIAKKVGMVTDPAKLWELRQKQPPVKSEEFWKQVEKHRASSDIRKPSKGVP